MNKIVLPKFFNYVGAFLSLRCNLHCPYCINHYGWFSKRSEMSGEDWIKGLSRIETREDFPITLQGGEPTIHNDFYDIVNGLKDKKLDILTNGTFPLEHFVGRINNRAFFRISPYANIRFSYHKGLNDKYLYEKLEIMNKLGYNVGVWGLDINNNKDMKEFCDKIDVDFRLKEYLDETHGTYKYPEAVNSISRKVECKPSELLIAPDGRLYRCHANLYSGTNSYGHILDEELKIPDDFYPCNRFGFCNPCDIKLKNNRLQQGGHCSVEVRYV